MATTLAPPGPKAHFLVGNLPELRRGRLDFYTRCAREYGDIAAFRFGPRRAVLLSHPDYIEQVLVTANRRFIKHFALRRSRLLLGNGLLTSEGDFWRRQRRLAQPAFHRNRVAAYGDLMVAYGERMLSTWQDGETRDIHADMMSTTLDIVAKVLFNADVADKAREVGTAMEVVQASFLARLNNLLLLLLPESVPAPSTLRLRGAVHQLEKIIYPIIQQRRASGDDPGDLLTMLLQVRDEDDGSRMTDQQLRDEVLTLFIAGHETTAIALSWTWYLLAQHPEVEAQLVAELQSVLAGRSPTVADLPALKYTEMVVLESMRLYPPAWLIGREAIEEYEIGSYRIPAGGTVLMSQWVVHRDPRFFDAPETFNPDRWADDLAKRLPRFAYFPFGGGPRLCIGNTFAQMEAILLLATVAQRYHLALVPDHPVAPQPSITLRPKDGIKVVVTRRS